MGILGFWKTAGIHKYNTHTLIHILCIYTYIYVHVMYTHTHTYTQDLLWWGPKPTGEFHLCLTPSLNAQPEGSFIQLGKSFRTVECHCCGYFYLWHLFMLKKPQILDVRSTSVMCPSSSEDISVWGGSSVCKSACVSNSQDPRKKAGMAVPRLLL